ncbi:hypothetical protein PsorP6_017097 [Peronosclerospora sorghi]|uniref:Uncharacterized protein n=1 Tax=Peronosclerospora sorghi TaxID=230839 RepID=A0ACC0WE99_9STRA|nr:hypothetical protein PsorP6_017097 [Peronosclerospora sorghi]
MKLSDSLWTTWWHLMSKAVFSYGKEALRNHFPKSTTALKVVEYGDQHPISFSTWLSKIYTDFTTTDLCKDVKARLRIFYEEKLNLHLVVFLVR